MSNPSDPTTRELLTHITYIRESVDDLRETTKGWLERVEDHEVRLVRLEERTPKSRMGAGIGGFLGGLLAGFWSSKAGG